MPLPTNSCSLTSKKAFVDDGFRTYKNAPGAFAPHEASELHKAAIVLILNKKKPSVIQQLSSTKQKEMLNNRIALNKIFSTILVLAKQGLALRGHDDENSNLHQILKVRCEDVPELKNWMNRQGYKWVHNTIVNEIVDMMAEEIRQKILFEIKKEKYFALMLDETSDISKLEQVSVCDRSVDENLSVHEYSMAFFSTPNAKSETL